MTESSTRKSWGRPLALIAAVLFVISWIFPLAAGLSKDTSSFPKWWGKLDVALAAVLAILALLIFGIVRDKVSKQAEDASYHAYRILIHGILAFGVVFIFFGDRITWVNWITGFAWRTWLLLYCLPAWLTLVRPASGNWKMA
jgi:hypothetical protein